MDTRGLSIWTRGWAFQFGIADFGLLISFADRPLEYGRQYYRDDAEIRNPKSPFAIGRSFRRNVGRGTVNISHALFSTCRIWIFTCGNCPILLSGNWILRQ